MNPDFDVGLFKVMETIQPGWRPPLEAKGYMWGDVFPPPGASTLGP